MSIADNATKSMLLHARGLDLPTREAVLNRAPSVQQFWGNNKDLLVAAWQEWEQNEKDNLFTPDDSLLDTNLRNAVEKAWKDPTKELAVQDLWREVSPGVFMAQFFDPERLANLRNYLEDTVSAKIPTRPPYGLALNRYGAMLDPRSEGYLAAPAFQAFYRELLDKYMRPISRLLLPEVMGYDEQTFGFSIQYQADIDASLRLHTDASSATLNINLNLPGEEFTGSEVDYYDPFTGKVNRLSFKPGMAMLHRCHIAHATQPITSGKRTNLVLWLYGDHGRLPTQYQPVIHDAYARWKVPSTVSDGFAPF